ncbi:MAG TPA: hypothetical protein VK010_03005 [Flavobacteriaceae bacterium]|nr:hypothetical protein [Flavobacteriaceae bacterium]
MKTNLSLLLCMASLFWCSVLQNIYAQQTREFVLSFKIGHNHTECKGFVVFDATFEDYDIRLSINNTRLYITFSHPETGLIEALENIGITKNYYKKIDTHAYKVENFDLFMTGSVSLGHYYKVYAPFEMQVSNSLGDFYKPTFKIKDKSLYTGDNSWENTGTITPYYPNKFEVTKIKFRDFNKWIKD